MRSGIIVSPATIDDLAFVRGEERGAVTGIAPEADEVIRLKITWQEILVAEYRQQRIGYLYFDYLDSSTPYITLIWVLEAHREQGVGKAMLFYLETSLRGKGHTMLYSSSSADEPRPQEWHRHVGFKECDFIPGLGEMSDEVLFCKKLS